MIHERMEAGPAFMMVTPEREKMALPNIPPMIIVELWRSPSFPRLFAIFFPFTPIPVSKGTVVTFRPIF
jgi:hypothetical protein